MHTLLVATISRRQMMRFAALGGLALTLAPKSVLARVSGNEPECTPTTSLKSEILGNHGHDFAMTLSELQDNAPLDVDITGNSWHSHSVRVTKEQVEQLLHEGRLSLESTRGALHRHTVVLTLIQEGCPF